MELPHKIVTDDTFVDEDGNPRKDVAIFTEYLLCHPDTLDYHLKLFKEIAEIELQLGEK